ncbi:MAG: hypothetical protein JXR97_03190 [Planctomycetes bacterium]|nr:hypothetical protein [Planctomycetota bacterium]
MKNFGRSNSEKGSVLVLCLGFLVILSLMATTFITTITLYRDISSVNQNSNLAELAALSGKAKALKKIREAADAEDATDTGQVWYSSISGGTGGTTKKALEAIGLTDTVTWDKIPGENDATIIVPVYYNIAGYSDEDMQSAIAVTSSEADFITRYTYYIIDLSGCVLLNVTAAATPAGTDYDNVMAGFTSKPTYPASPYYSWDQMKAENATVTDPEAYLNVTPFGKDELGCPWKININTASKALLTNIFKQALDAAGAPDKSAELANAVFANRTADTPFTDLSALAEQKKLQDAIQDNTYTVDEEKNLNTALSSLIPGYIDYDFNGTAPIEIGTGTLGLTQLTAEESGFFRVVVVGELYNINTGSVVSSKTLEFVYHSDKGAGTTSSIIYQKWH